jgi:hypothetical protein
MRSSRESAGSVGTKYELPPCGSALAPARELQIFHAVEERLGGPRSGAQPRVVFFAAFLTPGAFLTAAFLAVPALAATGAGCGAAGMVGGSPREICCSACA